MNYNEFFESIAGSDMTIQLEPAFVGQKTGKSELAYRSGQGKDNEKHLLSNEALFQLPLISLIILLMAKDRRKPKVSEVGQLVGECIEQSMPAFKGSSQQIGWSANLRVRTVKAIHFLEHTQLVNIPNRNSRVKITAIGKKIVNSALKKEDNLAYNLVQIARVYRNICVSRNLDKELI